MAEIENTHYTISRDDLPKFTGPHTPSKELEPYLKYLFPYVNDARSNIFFCYKKGRGFFSEFQRFWGTHECPRENDVTIVIENGANASKALDRKFTSLGIASKRTSCLYNCYQLISGGLEHSLFSCNLSYKVWSLLSADYRDISDSWGSACIRLDGPIVQELTNDQISQTAVVIKRPDFGCIPLVRLQLSRAFDVEPMPTLIGEVTRSHTADSLLMAARSWLGGSKLLVDSVLAVNLWHETLSIVFYQFDCRVENLIRLLGQYKEDIWKARSLRVVIRYKSLRWLIDLQLINFLIEHQQEGFAQGPLYDSDITADIEERFDQVNQVIMGYSELLQGLGDTQRYTIVPQRGLKVRPEVFIGHQDEINDSIGYYESILDTYSQNDEGNIAFSQALITVSQLVFDHSLSPAAVLGPVTWNWTVPEHIQVPIPVRVLVGFTNQEVHIAANKLTRLIRCISWDYMELGKFSIQLPGIEWSWIENPEFLAREKNTTVRELQQRLTHYLRGRIDLRDLTWGALEDTLNARREDIAQKVRQLDNKIIGTDRYLLELYRYLTHENAPDTLGALMRAVRLQYYFQQVFQRLLNEAERGVRDEQAGEAVTNRAARYERRVASRESTYNHANAN